MRSLEGMSPGPSTTTESATVSHGLGYGGMCKALLNRDPELVSSGSTQMFDAGIDGELHVSRNNPKRSRTSVGETEECTCCCRTQLSLTLVLVSQQLRGVCKVRTSRGNASKPEFQPY